MAVSLHPAIRWIDAILRLSKVLIFVTSTAFLTLVVLQVIFRYAFNNSILWADEAIRYLLYLTVMGSLGLIAASDADIKLGGLDALLPPKLRRILVLICESVVLLFSVIFIYASVTIVGRSWGQHSPVMEISMGWMYCAGIGGFTLMILGTIRKLIAGPIVLENPDDTDLQYRA